MNPPSKTTLAYVTASLIALTGCAHTSTYDERMDYLHKSAGRGVQTYKLLAAQAAKIDEARCQRVFDGGNVSDDMPNSGSTRTVQWEEQVREFFVESCVSGKPKSAFGELPQTGSPKAASSPSSVRLPPRLSRAKLGETVDDLLVGGDGVVPAAEARQVACLAVLAPSLCPGPPDSSATPSATPSATSSPTPSASPPSSGEARPPVPQRW